MVPTEHQEIQNFTSFRIIMIPSGIEFGQAFFLSFSLPDWKV